MSFAGFPPGTRFDPDDDGVLILEYLLPKVCNPQGFHSEVVFECDLYDEEEKWKAWFDWTSESKLYFFTKLKKKKKKEKGLRVERSFGQSVWKSQKEDVISLDPEQKSRIGYKRSFSYKVKNSDDGASSSSRPSGGSENNRWVMHEFGLHQDFAEWLGVGGNNSDRYVICCVRKKEERNGDSEIELIDAFPDSQ